MHNSSPHSRMQWAAILTVPALLAAVTACGTEPADQSAERTSNSSSTSTPVTPGPATPTGASASTPPPLEDAGGMTPLIKPTTTTESTTTSTETTTSSSTTESPSPTDTPISTAPPATGDVGSGSTLTVGSSGPDVLAVQQRLRQLGYWSAAPDGTFGNSTRQAVWAIQKAAGIDRTGKVDQATRGALATGVVPRSRTGAAKAIEIDLSRQLVLAVQGGRVVSVINASSGNGEKFTVKDKKTGKETEYVARTPRGSFQVYKEENKNHESTLELGSMWRPKYFHGAIALHGSGSVPPYPASHGCVRVANSAMNWLWDGWGLPISTPVTVY